MAEKKGNPNHNGGEKKAAKKAVSPKKAPQAKKTPAGGGSKKKDTANKKTDSQPVGAVMVVGGGIGGIQASLDLVDLGYKVYLVDSGPSIGGVMGMLDKTFPTNDCSMCILSPKMVEVGSNKNIEVITLADVLGVEGEPGDFKVKLRVRPRYVDHGQVHRLRRLYREVPGQGQGPLQRRPQHHPLHPRAVPAGGARGGVHRPRRCAAVSPRASAATASRCARRAPSITSRRRGKRSSRWAMVIAAPGYKPFDAARKPSTATASTTTW